MYSSRKGLQITIPGEVSCSFGLTYLPLEGLIMAYKNVRNIAKYIGLLEEETS